MCIQFNDGSTVKGPHMDASVFEEVARVVFPFVKRWQPSTSGEPTMSKNFYDMLHLARDFGVKADIVTNGTLLTSKMINALVPAVAIVMFSFDGHDPETFEFIREGADFDKVKANIKALVTRCRKELPEDQQPVFGINCTIMKKNIHGLTEILEIAAQEFVVDFVHVNHVFPVTEESKQQSLAHHQKPAKREIDRAFARARELKIPLVVEALDQLTARTATAGTTTRGWSTKDGVIMGLERREILMDGVRALPELSPSQPDYKSIMRRRQEAYEDSTLPPRRASNPRAAPREPIWFCDFLWNRLYVTVDRLVRPCCIFGVPVIGRLEKRLDDIWNNANYRAMRQHMVMKKPVAACRGCMHIQEITDPVAIDFYLQGSEVPTLQEISIMPAALDPTRTIQVDGEPAGRTPETLTTLASHETTSYPEIHGRISRHDPALPSTDPAAVERYRRVGSEAGAFLQDALAEVSRTARDVGSLLEFGCGFGRVTRALVGIFDKAKLSVFDCDPAAAAFCADEFGVHALYTRNLCSSVPFAKNCVPFETYDLIWLGSSLTDFSPDYINELFLVLKEILAPEGILAMATFGSRSMQLLREGAYGERLRRLHPQIKQNLEKTGISFEPYDSNRNENLGMTWFNNSYLRKLLARMPELLLERSMFEPARWDNHLDMVSYRREPLDT